MIYKKLLSFDFNYENKQLFMVEFEENNNRESKNNKFEKNINDLKKNLWDVDLYEQQYIKIDKNRWYIFDWIVKYKKNFYQKNKDFFLSIFNYSKDFFVKKEVWPKSINLMNNISKKIKNNKIINYIDNYKKLYFKAYIFIVSIFVFLCFVFVLKVIIEYKVNSGYQHLIDIKNTRDEKKIREHVDMAINDFRIAWFLFYPFSLIPTEKIEFPNHIIKWWKQIAYTINNLLKVYNNLNIYVKKEWINNLKATEILKSSKKEVFAIESDLSKALLEYNSIKDLKEWPLNAKFELWKKYLNNLEKYLLIIKSNYQTFLNILWDKNEKKYLVVFQNADEIRPTWGFMWSMWVIYLKKWKIVKFEPKDVYAHEWNLKKEDYMKLKAPEWLNTITGILWLRDSNYSYNYQISSEQINFFMKKIWYELDWIIYINNTIIEDFLKITGNISFTKVGENIRYNNFSEIMSLLVESKKFKEWSIWTPKQILFDFIEEFKARLVKDGNYLSYLKVILDNVTKREIVIYSFSPKENKLLSELDINWKIDYKSSLDFAYPIYTSISWNKSDRYVARKYEKTIKKNKDCSYDTSFKLSLTHNFTIQDESELKDLIKKYEITTPWTMYIQWEWRNRQFVRIALPKNTIIDDSKNYVIEETPTLKFVKFYLQTNRFETRSVTIKYKLLNQNCQKYSFNLYKQAWVRKYDIVFRDDDEVTEKKNIANDFVY